MPKGMFLRKCVKYPGYINKVACLDSAKSSRQKGGG
jgi:hypothetical protein